MTTKIGGTVVARGASIKWQALISVLLGSVAYAYYEGFLGLLYGFSDFVTAVVSGPSSAVARLLDLEFGASGRAMRSAWNAFGTSVEAFALSSWIASALMVALVLLVLFVFLRRAVGVVRGG